MRATIILTIAIVLNASANILIKVGMARVDKSGTVFSILKQGALQPALLCGIVSFALALAAYSVVLTRLHLSVAYPTMVSLGLIIVVLASYFLLNEAIRWPQVIGFVLIIAGVWLVAR